MKIRFKIPNFAPLLFSAVMALFLLFFAFGAMQEFPWFNQVINSGSTDNILFESGAIVGAVASAFFSFIFSVLYTLFSCFSLKFSSKEVQE